MSEHHTLAPLRRIRTDVLEVAYYETGSAANDTVLLLHGFPYDIHSYVAVAPLLAESGFRVVVPYLRGHGPTRFLSDSTPRSGQQAALGVADGNFPATDGSPTTHHFTGLRLHRTVAGAGHNLPQERPAAFATAVRDVRELRRENTGRERFVGRRQDTP
ncbi:MULTISPECIES: alpha/beta fold hydrolase [unclassified Nonomuraea]|uniref:alpha/beta fold hydrolase n=1 Tax=unclassified Nonomuraea TaxID=2593643 RepID=UPI00341042EE